ncbi:Bor family protein [Schleiferia thermophila]|nr:Bor family protein [Schleiferia thermophila]
MKKVLFNLILVMAISVLMTSCYTLTFSVGEGAKTGIEVCEKNHYLIYGLAPVKTADPSIMAGGAKDYTVTITHTFVDGLLNAITGGIYTLTTTIVKK